MKLLIAGGGTGGHVFPAIAIAQEWLARGKEREVVLVGTQRGIEMKLVRKCNTRVAAYCILGGIKEVVGQASLRKPRNIDALVEEILAFGLIGVARPDLLRSVSVRGEMAEQVCAS